jgi:dihydrofolate reductase
MEAIVAVYADWGIGYKGTQPLVIPADRKRFREITGGSAVIYGRRTMADFPGGKPLPKRRNLVLTRSDTEIPGAVAVRCVEDALREIVGEARVFVIGGGSVYEALLPYITRVYVTKINAAPVSDTFFANLDTHPEFALSESSGEYTHEGCAYRFCVYERITENAQEA